MHRVDTEGHDAGQFQDGTPQIGQQGTILSADWFNDLQENVCTVIEGAGIALDKGDPDQLKDAIAAMIATAQTSIIAATRVPVGTIIALDGPTVPAGYLALAGGQYVRATYPDLVAYYTAQARLIAGDTGAQFRVPDYRGRFLRGWSADATVDTAGPRAPGSLQADDFKAHTHTLPSQNNPNAGATYVEDADSSGGAQSATTGSTGGLETRPKNVAVMWAVKT